MLQAVILVCAVAVGDCTPENAVDVLRTPVLSGNPSTCFMHGQAYLAETSIELRPGDRIKIACVRKGV